MVTKQFSIYDVLFMSFVLAKKLMVTKLNSFSISSRVSFVLAKKLMVTKRLYLH